MPDKWEFPCTADEFFERWEQIPYRRTNQRHDQLILAVDASGKIGPKCGGAGVLYIAEYMTSGKCYQMNFLGDLNVHLDLNKSWEIEMFNLLFALCFFKQELANCNKVRIICDHEKIKNAKKGGALVLSIRNIIEHLKIRETVITDDPNNLYEFRPVTALDKILRGVADRLSKGFPIPSFKDDYELLKGYQLELLRQSLVQKFKYLFENEHGGIDRTEPDGRQEDTGGTEDLSNDELLTAGIALIGGIATIGIGLGLLVIGSKPFLKKSKR